jgi:hypothetical protein
MREYQIAAAPPGGAPPPPPPASREPVLKTKHPPSRTVRGAWRLKEVQFSITPPSSLSAGHGRTNTEATHDDEGPEVKGYLGT